MTLDTVADESRKKIADGVARSPSRRCSRDGKICCCRDALSTIFMLAFMSCFLLFVFRFSFFLYFFPCIPVCFIFFVSLRLCSSHLLLSASLYFIVRVLSPCHLYPTPSPNYFVFHQVFVCFFRSSYFSGGDFLWCSRTRYAST